MLRELRAALSTLILLGTITGVVYPLLLTLSARALFPDQAQGSLILRDGVPVGSRLVGQAFDEPGYFWGRLSGTATAYDGGASSGTNYGPLHPALLDAARARLDALGAADRPADVPIDLVTASGSGLDPHVSPAAARFQVPRVARARGLDEARVAELVERHVEPRQLGFLGEPRVDVLELNLALDALR